MARGIGVENIFYAVALAALMVASINTASAAAPLCPAKQLAKKYPGLVGKTLIVAVPGDSKPISYRDPSNLDRLTGFAPDYARAAFQCLGVHHKFKVASFAGGIAAASSGQVDMVWSTIYYTPKRAKVIDFVLYQRAASGGIVLRGNPKHIRSLNDLCGYRAVAQIGSLEQVKLQQASEACLAAKKKPIQILTSPNRASGLRLLESKRVDLYLGLGLKEAYPDAFDLAFIYDSSIRAGIGITKGKTELEHALVDALTALQASGFERKLYTKYEIDPSLSFKPVIVTH